MPMIVPLKAASTDLCGGREVTRVPTATARGFDRDLIRGGHYGQRSCEPHEKAEHMAAPTNVKKVLANSEPSTWHFFRISSSGSMSVAGES
jgi:hypothetical protein